MPAIINWFESDATSALDELESLRQVRGHCDYHKWSSLISSRHVHHNEQSIPSNYLSSSSRSTLLCICMLPVLTHLQLIAVTMCTVLIHYPQSHQLIHPEPEQRVINQ